MASRLRPWRSWFGRRERVVGYYVVQAPRTSRNDVGTRYRPRRRSIREKADRLAYPVYLKGPYLASCLVPLISTPCPNSHTIVIQRFIGTYSPNVLHHTNTPNDNRLKATFKFQLDLSERKAGAYLNKQSAWFLHLGLLRRDLQLTNNSSHS